MNQQPAKRRNPFDVPRNEEKEPVIEQTKDFIEDEPVYEEEIVQVKPVIKPTPVQSQPKVVQRQQYYQQDDVNREKYTSTMDVTLRRQIKIICATRGIMFAKFVEDACKEKLAREGVR